MLKRRGRDVVIRFGKKPKKPKKLGPRRPDSIGGTWMPAHDIVIAFGVTAGDSQTRTPAAVAGTWTPKVASIGGAEHPNEPGGYAGLSDRSFDAKQEDFQNCHYCDNLVIVSDPTAPKSPNNVGRVKFRAGDVDAGKSLMPISSARQGFNYNNLYCHFWFKVSSNWKNHQSTTNKIFYITDSSTGGGGSPFYLNAHGAAQSSPDAALDLRGQMQHPNWSNRGLNQNVTSIELVRGTWYEVEILLKMNLVASPVSSDGEFHMWIDGTKVCDYDNIKFSDGDRKWDNFRWEPIWGGQNDTVDEEMYQFIDHLYLSGSNN